jgi:hypothetical protein
MADAPGSWLTRLKPFQAVLVGGFLIVLLVLGLYGTGNYSLFGVLSVDNRTEEFQDFFTSRLENQPAEIRRQYLERAIIAALNVAETQGDDFDRTRFITSLEPHLSHFDAYRLAGGLLRDRLDEAQPELSMAERQRIASAALRGIGRLAGDKDGPAASDELDAALVALGYRHYRSPDFVEALRQLDVADPNARRVRELLYALEGPFRTPELFLEASGEFIRHIHELKQADAQYYRHDVVRTLWDDASRQEGIFEFERSGVEVRVELALERGQATLCREEGDLHGKQFFLLRGRAFAHVQAQEQTRSRDCTPERLNEAASLTVWLSALDAARLLDGETRPLQSSVLPIRDVVLRRSISQDFLPLSAAPKIGDTDQLEAIAAELRRLL